MPIFALAVLRRRRRNARTSYAQDEQTRLPRRGLSLIGTGSQDASQEVTTLRARLKTQRYTCARRARTIHHLGTKRTKAKRATSPRPSTDLHDKGVQANAALTLVSNDTSIRALEKELELQRILAKESRRHAEELEESYAEILAFKDALLAGLRADYADVVVQLRVTRKEVRRARVDSSLRDELHALEAELDEQYQLLTHAAQNAVGGANRMSTLVLDNTTLRNERDDLAKERNALVARVRALESACVETDEQRAYEADFLEHLRDELASATAYAVTFNSPDLATDQGSETSSPLTNLPNLSTSSLLNEDLPASLPLSPRSPSYTDSMYSALSSPPPQYSHPASAFHSRSSSLYTILEATNGSPLSPSTSLPSLPSSDPATIRAFEVALGEHFSTGAAASGSRE